MKHCVSTTCTTYNKEDIFFFKLRFFTYLFFFFQYSVVNKIHLQFIKNRSTWKNDIKKTLYSYYTHVKNTFDRDNRMEELQSLKQHFFKEQKLIYFKKFFSGMDLFKNSKQSIQLFFFVFLLLKR